MNFVLDGANSEEAKLSARRPMGGTEDDDINDKIDDNDEKIMPVMSFQMYTNVKNKAYLFIAVVATEPADEQCNNQTVILE